MRIAYLILAHKDPEHIARLVQRISNENCDVFIHIDLKYNVEQFKEKIKESKRVYFIKDRVDVYWGGFSAIKATMNLIKYSIKVNKYDRYVLLQGLDYPIVSNDFILSFFEKNNEIEFIRGCNITRSKEKYFYQKCRYYWFFDNINNFKRIINRTSRMFNIKVRRGVVRLEKKECDIFWGAAQWALTDKCIKYILEVYTKEFKYNKYFEHVFPADETYFHTIIFNSKFASRTMNGGPEKEKKYLVNWRALHYFEYENQIKTFTEKDYDHLRQQNVIFIRKVDSETSLQLLDLIDRDIK